MNRKIFLHISLLFALFLFLPAQVEAKNFIVVIDPGHGGKDPGAIGATTNEKTINLAVALKLGKMIEQKHKDVKVVYTRSTDKFVGLDERANIANRNKADLFISIHANSAAKGSTARGTETFTLGLARTDENLQVAMRENAAILMEDDYLEKYEGFDPKSSESYIIFEFMQNKHMEQSIFLASEIETAFKSSARRSSRGVKQAGLLVLRKTSMPSVLIELGFISNREEENFMKSADGQNKLSNAIYSAFAKYKHDYDRKEGLLASGSNGNSKPITSPATSNSSTTKTENNSGQIVYKVQILASDKKLPENSKQLKGYKNISYYQENGLYKYTYGESTNLQNIQQIRRKVAQDFKDAFIVKFKDGKKITN